MKCLSIYKSNHFVEKFLIRINIIVKKLIMKLLLKRKKNNKNKWKINIHILIIHLKCYKKIRNFVIINLNQYYIQNFQTCHNINLKRSKIQNSI
jgi:hypothetical protein